MPYQYQPYQPTWNNPYMQQTVPQGYSVTSPMPNTQPVAAQPQTPQQAWNSVKVDGLQEAMNRFLMHYPANMLVPGFVSEPLFDIDGRHFYTLSIEQDGRRNPERFRYEPDFESQGFSIDGA